MHKLFLFLFTILTISFFAYKSDDNNRAKCEITYPALNSSNGTIAPISTNNSQITANNDGSNAFTLVFEGNLYVKKYKNSKRENLGGRNADLDNEKAASGLTSISDSKTLYITNLTDAAKIITKKLLL
jgi:hypothetical protein